MKNFFTILSLILLLSGCSSDNTTKDIDIKKIMSENEYVIVDVRTKEEYEESHLVGAINIPYDQINESSDFDKYNIIFVYCKSGGRSKIAFDELDNLGYTVYDLGAFDQIDLPKE